MRTAQVHYFHAHVKSPASKARVNAMAATAVLHFSRAAREAAKLEEEQRKRQIVCNNLQFAIRQMYAVMGPEEANKLINWTEAAVEVEYRFKS